jgi:hypothetical protein
VGCRVEAGRSVPARHLAGGEWPPCRTGRPRIKPKENGRFQLLDPVSLSGWAAGLLGFKVGASWLSAENKWVLRTVRALNDPCR